MRTRKAHQWLVGVSVAVATVAAVGAMSRVLAPPPPRRAARAASQVSDVDGALREAALARFKNGRVHLRMGNGTEIATLGPEHETQIKVNLFKKLLAQERMKQDPTFQQRAVQSLLHKRPADVIITWEDASGSQQVRFLAEATASCALPRQPVFQIEAGKLSQHPCLQMASLKTFWDGEEPILTVEVLPLDSLSQDWPHLLEEEQKSLAAHEFLRTQGHRMPYSPEPSEKEE